MMRNITFVQKITILRFALLFFVVAFTIFAPAADAQIIPCGYEDAPGGKVCTIQHLFQLLVNIYNFLLGMAAIVAMLMIIIGGVGMFVYHWFENSDEILKNSKHTVSRAIFGMIVIAAAYVIVNTLLVLLGVQNPENFFLGGFLG